MFLKKIIKHFIFLFKKRSLKKGLKKENCKFDGDSYIISLTSYKKRLSTVWMTIESLFEQKKCKINSIVLWVAEDDKSLIDSNLSQLVKKGLVIRYCDDIKSYKKLVFSLKEYSDKNIITVDDDVIYPKKYISKLISLHKNNPECICCYRAHKILFSDNKILPYNQWSFFSLGVKGPAFDIMAIGIGGILYPSGKLTYNDIDFKVVNQIAPYTDDIYFKWIELCKGISVVKVNSKSKNRLIYIENTQEIALKNINVDKNNNDVAIKNLEEYYGISLYKLIKNND